MPPFACMRFCRPSPRRAQAFAQLGSRTVLRVARCFPPVCWGGAHPGDLPIESADLRIRLPAHHNRERRGKTRGRPKVMRCQQHRNHDFPQTVGFWGTSATVALIVVVMNVAFWARSRCREGPRSPRCKDGRSCGVGMREARAARTAKPASQERSWQKLRTDARNRHREGERSSCR